MASGIAHRAWSISREEFRDEYGKLDEQAFRAAVQNEMALAEHIGERLGVAIVAAPVRTRLLPDGDYFTAGWRFKTASIPADAAPGEVVAVDGDHGDPIDVDLLASAA